MSIDLKQVKQYKWNGSEYVSHSGNVGLITILEYMQAQLGTSCNSLNEFRNNYCNTNNWLYISSQTEWTISPDTTLNSGVIYIVGETIGSLQASNSYAAHPVIFLKSDIKLTGSGTKSQPYKILNS